MGDLVLAWGQDRVAKDLIHWNFDYRVPASSLQVRTSTPAHGIGV